jgi:hypothetical protein
MIIVKHGQYFHRHLPIGGCEVTGLAVGVLFLEAILVCIPSCFNLCEADCDWLACCNLCVANGDWLIDEDCILS